MLINRRDTMSRVILGLLAPAVAGALAGLAPVEAHALSKDEARAHVEATIKEIVDLVQGPGDTNTKADKLLEIMKRRSALPQIARFAAGVAWRSMSDDQQKRFVTAFGEYLSGIYARRFEEYSGKAATGDGYTVGGVVDAGKKGLIVQTTVKRPDQPPVEVDWLISDAPGRVVIADIVIEGVSMLITQREEIGGMLEARGGNIDKLINDMKRA
jgi:phospholipid transport system substrate-binding protein